MQICADPAFPSGEDTERSIIAAPIIDRPLRSAQIGISCIRHPEGVKRPRQSVPFALPISGKSVDLPGYLFCFLLFQELRFLCLCKESSKESTRRRGEKNLPALRSTPLRVESFLFRSSAAAQEADMPALLMKCFQLETQILSPMKRRKVFL